MFIYCFHIGTCANCYLYIDGTLVNSIAAVEAAWGKVADEIGQPRKSVIEVRMYIDLGYIILMSF